MGEKGIQGAQTQDQAMRDNSSKASTPHKVGEDDEEEDYSNSTL